jgi:phosphoglycerate dehydrogenase-like enzyme
MRILVTAPYAREDEELYPPPVLDRLEALGEVTYNDTGDQYVEAQLSDHLEGVDVCLTGWGCPTLTEAVLSGADSLQLVAHVGGSVAAVASDALYDREIAVCSANRVMAPFVSEAVLAYTLSALRSVPQFDGALKRGEWPDNRVFPSETLYGATVGFVGLGEVGRNLLGLLEPFDVTVNVYDPYVSTEDLGDVPFATLTDLDETLETADVVSIHASMTSETYHMLDTEKLALLADGCLLVNAARGAIVDEDALVTELDSRRLGAALDVYEAEPLPGGHPFRDQDGAVLGPHVAGNPSRGHLADAVVAEVERLAAGDPLQHTVPRERYELMTRPLEAR